MIHIEPHPQKADFLAERYSVYSPKQAHHLSLTHIKKGGIMLMQNKEWIRQLCIPITFVLLFACLMPAFAAADQVQNTAVITLGSDLSEKQQKQMLQHFGEPKGEVLTVTNEEEHQMLSGLLPREVIGNRAISSALVTLQEEGFGIQVSTHNITWVTEQMYTQALTTAGVQNAEVRVAAPFPVSGTAGLTGIMKAFETATDTTLGEHEKKTAAEEMVLTAKLAELKGDPEKVTEFIGQFKKELAIEKLNEQQMSDLIDKLSAQIGLTITPEEKESLISLGLKIQELDINWEQVIAQGEKLLEQTKGYLQQNPEVKSWVQSLWEQCKRWIDELFSSVSV
jgi:uncharacterized protein YpuA (DUF1002 family)